MTGQQCNVLKCKVMSVTKSRSPILFNYFINGQPIERVTVTSRNNARKKYSGWFAL